MSLEKASVAALWVALALTAGAAVAYWGHLLSARGLLLRVGNGAVVGRWRPPLGMIGTSCTWLALGAMVASLLCRWLASQRPPWANMWEFTAAFTGAVMAFHVLFERAYGQRMRVVGAVVQPLVLALLAVNMAFFPWRVEPLVPALQSRGVLAAHVGIMVLAYGAFTVSFGAAVLQLLQGEGRRFSWLPQAAALDVVAFRSVAVGFPLLTVGIAIGAYWGNMAWGRYWGWDPKETSSLVTWLIYGVYLHLRAVRGWRGISGAWVLVVAYLSVLFTYFGVNLAISGLHSYAGV
jgi:cytochrome c-type biogenesis protein CcsB